MLQTPRRSTNNIAETAPALLKEDTEVDSVVVAVAAAEVVVQHATNVVVLE